MNLFCVAQKERNVWRMGYYPCYGNPFEMDFNSGHLIINPLLNTNIMNMQATNAGICNKNGKLLFYTNGIYIANSQHDTMENGTGLNPGQFASNYTAYGLPVYQGALVLPDPVDSNEFYLFHMDMNTNNLTSQALLVTKIDMRLDSGLGGVTYKNNPVYSHLLVGGQLTAVKHANGRDWWIVLHHLNTDEFVYFLLSVNGLNTPIIQDIGNPFGYPIYALFSPDGKKYAASYDDGRYVDLFNFNRCTGTLSNFVHLKMPGNDKAFGCSFSKKSQLFYVSTQYNIFQYNLKAPDIGASIIKVSTWDSIPDPSSATFHHQQLGPDGKIYICGWGGSFYLNVINFPDNLGSACDVQQHSILQHGQNNGVFPNYPFYELGELKESVCDSLINNTNLTLTNENDIEIFPNPSNDKVYLNVKENNTNGKIFITNLYGQLLNPRIINFSEYFEIDITDLLPGVYLLKYNLKEKQFVKKIVKN